MVYGNSLNDFNDVAIILFMIVILPQCSRKWIRLSIFVNKLAEI